MEGAGKITWPERKKSETVVNKSYNRFGGGTQRHQRCQGGSVTRPTPSCHSNLSHIQKTFNDPTCHKYGRPVRGEVKSFCEIFATFS